MEDNKYALSVHYRNVVEAPGAPVGEGSMGPQVTRLFSAVSAILEEHGDALELRRGKMVTTQPQQAQTCFPMLLTVLFWLWGQVFELRPKLEWNKGCALMWILGALSLTADAKEGSQASLEGDICPFYLGDDITDEDAFLALRNLKGSPALGQGAPAFPAGVGVLVSDVSSAVPVSKSQLSTDLPGLNNPPQSFSIMNRYAWMASQSARPKATRTSRWVSFSGRVFEPLRSTT